MELPENEADLNRVVRQRILVADDDPPTRMLLRAAIAQWGYEVVEASDGEEAWNILQQPDVPQLLIVDWLMPKLDGIDLNILLCKSNNCLISRLPKSIFEMIVP